jgi:hypothetical protein
MRCVCGFSANLDPRFAAWHRAHRVVHLEVFPGADVLTRKNLDTMVETYEQREESRVS